MSEAYRSRKEEPGRISPTGSPSASRESTGRFLQPGKDPMNKERLLLPSSQEEALMPHFPRPCSVTIPLILQDAGKSWNIQTQIGLLKRAKDPYGNGCYPYANAWELGGGNVREKEDPYSCVCREIAEERALNIPRTQPVFVGISPYHKAGQEVGNWIFYVPVSTRTSVDWSRIKQPGEHVQEEWKSIQETLDCKLAFKHWEMLVALSIIYGDHELRMYARHLLIQRKVNIVIEPYNTCLA